MPTPPCKSIVTSGMHGLRVETWSGDAQNVECNVNNRPGIKHVVRVKSLMTYNVKLTCLGTIEQKPASVRFASTSPDDGPTQWRFEVSVLANQTNLRGRLGENTIAHVEIQTVNVGTPTTIRTQVTANWQSSTVRPTTLTTDISVTG